MKKIVLLLAIVALGSQAAYAYFGITPASGVTPAKSQETKTEQVIKEEGLQTVVPTNITKEEFLKLTPKKIKEATGKKLTMKEAIGLKMAQKAIKKQDGAQGQKGDGEKTQLVAFILCFLVGVLGIHRFYTGHIAIGIIQLLTGGGCGIWTLIDLIRIAMGEMKTKSGDELTPW